MGHKRKDDKGLKKKSFLIYSHEAIWKVSCRQHAHHLSSSCCLICDTQALGVYE